MNNKEIPLEIDGIRGSIYAGFWLRLSSMLLDTIIMLPIFFLTLYINGIDKDMHYLTIFIGIAFYFCFSIYLVKRYGGTPGKLILGIKILKMDAKDVRWREAILREIVSLILTVFGAIITMYALSIADDEYYMSLGWIKQKEYLMGLVPLLFKVHIWANNIWVYSELFFLLFNKRKRALHDLIANTVIVKKIYIEKIREAMNNEQSATDVL